MVEIDETHPWYIARLKLIEKIATNGLLKKSKILDFGCGSGAVLEMLFRHGFQNLTGIDKSKTCIAYAKKRFQNNLNPKTTMMIAKLQNHKRSDICLLQTSKIPTDKEKFDLILALDVLEHMRFDLRFLRSLENKLTERGRIIITVPAHNFLWRKHDMQNKHFRRYSKSHLLDLVSKTRLQVKNIRYWNSLLFPLFLCSALLEKSNFKLLNKIATENSGFKLPSKSVSRLISSILGIESRIKLLGYLIGVTIVLELEVDLQDISRNKVA